MSDREVIIQIIKIIMQEYPGNSRHIVSDNIMNLYFKRYISASQFIMDIDIYIMFNTVQDCFTKELNIQLKTILEKITQVDFDITLLIKNCGEVQHIYITLSSDFVDLIKQKQYSKHLLDISYIREKYIRSWKPEAHIHLKKKSIIKFDIFMDILDILGHFAQRGHQPPSDIEMDISDFKWHFAINIEFHLLGYSSISGPNYLFVTSAINLHTLIKADGFIRVSHLPYINLLNNMDIATKTEQFIRATSSKHHRLDFSSISGPNCISITFVINLDIMVKAERFIRTTHHLHLLSDLDIDIKAKRFIITIRPDYILFINVKGINQQAPSGDHQKTLKSHCGASSMSTSEEHIIYVQDIIVKRKGLDIKTVHIDVTTLSLSILKMVFNKYLIEGTFIDHLQDQTMIIAEYIFYDHSHIVALHQWEAQESVITCACTSGNGASRSHHIEWRDNIFDIIGFNLYNQHLIYRRKPNYFIKNIYTYIQNINIDYQEFIGIIYNLYIETVQNQLTITNIDEAQYLLSIIQNNSVDYINHIIFKKKNYNIRSDTSIIDIFNLNIIPLNSIFNILTVSTINNSSDNIFEYINYTHLALLNNININGQVNSIIQEDDNILNFHSQNDTYNDYITFSHLIDISSQDITTLYIVNYVINRIITIEFVISIMLQRFTDNHIIPFFISQQLNIIYHTDNILNTNYKLDTHSDQLINLFENYITFHLMITSVVNITVNLIYIHVFISELYKTISETNVIKYVETFETSYSGAKASEIYISINDTDISAYTIIIVAELYDTIQKIRDIIYLKTSGSSYVVIMASKIDNTIMSIRETSKLILVDILNGRISRAMC